MADNLYCEPCRRLLRGEQSVISHDERSITFNHHHDFESFDTAMQLPCLICSLAYTHAKIFPSKLNWVKSLGYYYCYNGEQWLRFYPDSQSGWLKPSQDLALVPWSDLSEYNISSDLSSSTQSNSAINFLLEKYHNCRKEHAQCNLVEKSNPVTYPSRLLDVGTEEHSLIILRSTDSFRDEEYVCLSHCWGINKPFTLNAETQYALTKGINLRILPKTFQDAISVTRRLKIQYLWIDSLCIIQDNKDDWATESGRMGDVYAHATCTVAATASEDSSGGLFFDRRPQQLIPRRINFDFNPTAPWLEEKEPEFALTGTYLCDIVHLAGIWIESAPLNSRAWVSQERQLSRRILHFTETQLFWECNEGTTCETYPERLPPHARPHRMDNATTLKQDLCRITDQGKKSSVQGLDDSTHYAWGIYRLQYSRCALTHDTDKLVALQGIANRVSQATGDEFVAGLWRSRIIGELGWMKYTPTARAAKWRAPTWSWSSRDGDIHPSYLSRFHQGHSDRHIEAELVELDVRANVSGELEYASMKIKCRPLQAIFTPAAAIEPLNDDSDDLLELIDRDRKILELRDPAVHFWLDDDTRPTGPQHGYVVVLQLCLHERTHNRTHTSSDATRNSNDEEGIEQLDSGEEGEDASSEKAYSEFDALFLQISDKVEGKFERRGLVSFVGSRAVNQILKAHRMAEENVITLI